MPEAEINGIKVQAVRVDVVYEGGRIGQLKEGYIECPVWTNFDNGTWEGFLAIQREFSKMKCLTEEELEALAEYCWKYCREWKGSSYMNYWVFLINGKKVVGFSFRGWGGFMSRVRHKMTGVRAKPMDYMEWY